MKRFGFNRRFGGAPTSARSDHGVGGRGVTFVLVLLASVLISACTTGPRRASTTASLPALKYELDYSAGSPRSAFTPVETSSLRAEDSPVITVTLLVGRRLPTDFLAAAELQTSMITVFPAARIVAPVARLTKGARIGSIEDAERFIIRLTDQEPDGAVLLQRFHGVLPPEVTAHFRFMESNPADSQLPEGVEIQVCRRSETMGGSKEESPAVPSLEIALVASGGIKQKTVLGDESSKIEGDSETNQDLDRENEDLQVTETILLEPRPFRERDQLAIIVPSPFGTKDAVSFAIAIDVRPPPAEDRAAAAMHRWSFNECMKQLTGADMPGQIQGAEPADADWPGLENAIRALQSYPNQRRALLYLAERTGASLVEDIALSGTDMVVGRLSQALTNEYSSGSMTGGALLEWTLERTAYGLLANLLSSDQATPELEAILVRHTGQVGRNVSTLEELTAGAAGIDEFQKLLVRENFIYLEDISPAARTRAFEWLTARGRAPEGYHPLAPAKERRAVLNRVEKGFDLE